MRVALVGATDLTLAVAGVLDELAEIDVVACVGAPSTIRVGYAPEGRPNHRHADLAGWAAARGIPHHEFSDNPTLRAEAEAWEADLAVVAGWYHIVPRSVRRCFRLGAVGLHASLLPQFRGGAPLNWAILSGAQETGISLFLLEDGVDEGDVYGQARVEIGPRTTVGDLVSATTHLGLDLLRTCLPAIARGELEPVAQEGIPSYTLHREPADGRIRWDRPADEIDRLVRAVTHPYPGASTTLDGDEVVVWATEPRPDAPKIWSEPGGIARIPGFDDPLVVTGEGVIAIREATAPDGTDLMERLRASAYRRLT